MPSTYRTHSRFSPTSWLILLAAFSSLASGSALAESVAEQVSGKVEIGRGDPPRWRALRTGETIESNDRIRTGADGRVEITLDAGTIRVHENSVLRLPPATDQADQVELEQGHSLFDVLRRSGRRFEVHTPTVVVSVKGTRFGVDATGEMGEVIVYRGVVGVREAGQGDTIEILVREGFLATGGVGSPIELDVAPMGDPWVSWQDFRHDMREHRQAPARMNEVDRARTTLHRATNADVLLKAAERKPEVAERLRKIQRDHAERSSREEKDAAAKAGSADHEGQDRNDPSALPAAPMLGDDEPDASRRQILQKMMQDGDSRSRRRQSREKAENELAEMLRGHQGEKMQAKTVMKIPDPTGLSPNVSGTGLSLTFLSSLDENDLNLLLNTYSDTRISFVDSTGTLSFTTTDFLDQLERELITNGLDPVLANDVITKMNGG